MVAPTRKRIFGIVGESRETKDGVPRQTVLIQVEPGDEVNLERQRDNQYDTNAICVFWEGCDIGFLSKEDARIIAPALDDQQKYKAQIHELKGGVSGYSSYGAKISIAWGDKQLLPFKPLDEKQVRSRRSKLAALNRSRGEDGAFSRSSSKNKSTEEKNAAQTAGGCLSILVGVVLLSIPGIQLFN